jgi:hypothetical protein
MASIMTRRFLYLAAAALAASSQAIADPYIVGDRYFVPAPLTEDPFVSDEAVVSVDQLRPRADGGGRSHETDFDGEIDLRLTDRLGLAIDHGYSIVDMPGTPHAYGFQNPEAALRFQLIEDEAHQSLFSVGVSREFAGIGAAGIGSDRVGNTTPALYFARGLGDLPASFRYLTPIALIGSLGYQISDEPVATTTIRASGATPASLDRAFFPNQIEPGLAIEYSLRYLEGNVAYLGLPETIDRLSPLFEIDAATPTGRSQGEPTTITLAPGFVYAGDAFYLGVEAIVPATRATGMGTGFLATLTIRLDSALPAVFGTPLFGANRGAER